MTGMRVTCRTDQRYFLAVSGLAALLATEVLAGDAPRPVARSDNGRLVYFRDDSGDLVPDFSFAGYRDGQVPPHVPVAIIAPPPSGDDDTNAIERAIDTLRRRNDDRPGAVVLQPGRYHISRPLVISASGIVLRGSGAHDGGTELVRTGTDRSPVIMVRGEGEGEVVHDAPVAIALRTAVGSTQLQMESVSNLHPGDLIVVSRACTDEWIATLGANRFGASWHPGSRIIRWHRKVIAMDGNTITVNAPLTTAIDPQFGGGTVERIAHLPYVTDVGIEDMTLVSQYDASCPHDEDHAWYGVTMEQVRDGWVRRVRCRHFSGGAVALWETAQRVTVADCVAVAPVSEIAGHRRRTFYTQGEQSLFLRCYSEQGMHDFAVGHCTAGPSAFVNCRAIEAHGHSGSLGSWASGVLFDNVAIDGAGIEWGNRWSQPLNCAWSSANCMTWNCLAATLRLDVPPTAHNWAVGYWATPSGNGAFHAESEYVEPLSLYYRQMVDRCGAEAARHLLPMTLQPAAATNPSLVEASEFVAATDVGSADLRRQIESRMAEPAQNQVLLPQLHSDRVELPSDTTLHQSTAVSPVQEPIACRDGWLTCRDQILVGGTVRAPWWRGTVEPDAAQRFGPAITRFVPGRIGPGFTDRLDDVVRDMKSKGQVAYEHHYGLWYDRRRDDHLFSRRHDRSVEAPFYEQPFRRTGTGSAWDGLSRYDLRDFNPWYWSRISEFAQRCRVAEIVFFHQHFFQHQILEAAAHWSDSPWRPANNVNETGLPEPPHYIGNKRVFMAHRFYDPSDKGLRGLQRGYIRQCLNATSDCDNVFHSVGAEFTGPLEFVQFWLDTIGEWEIENGMEARVCLSVPKEIQDAILSDPHRRPLIDLVDIRYWTYSRDGLFAPPGGSNLSPRQHWRRERPQISFDSVVRSLEATRRDCPQLPITYRAQHEFPLGDVDWAVLMGGGSLASLPPLPTDLLTIIPTLRPTRKGVPDGAYCLTDGDTHWIVYYESGSGLLQLVGSENARIGHDLVGHDRYVVQTFDASTGERTGKTCVRLDTSEPFRVTSPVTWIRRDDPAPSKQP